jgi:hypothetical protein
MSAVSESASDQSWISWRDDPADTFCDITAVTASPHDADRTYHVYKNIVATGPRKSAYFERLFKTASSEK